MAVHSFEFCWQFLTDFSQKRTVNRQQLKEAFQVLKSNDLLEFYKEWYLETFRSEFTVTVIPCFWRKLPQSKLPCDLNAVITSDFSLNSSNGSYETLFQAVAYLHEEFDKSVNNEFVEVLFEILDERVETFHAHLRSLLKSILLSQIQLHFNDYVLLAYCCGFSLSRHLRAQEKHLCVRMTEEGEDSSDADSIPDTRCSLCEGLIEALDSSQQERSIDENGEFCKCQIIMDKFVAMNSQLKELGLLEVVSEDAVASVTHSLIEKKIRETCHGNFDVSCLKKLEDWVRCTIVGWLETVYDKENKQLTKNSEERLIHFMYETYAQIRTDQMFDIIVEFPESEPSLEDLKDCLHKCHGYRQKVIKSLKDSFEVRLLHPGVATNDILTAYIQAIKSLRILDSSGVILQLVCDPVKKYLKSREDTVRCIITALTDENSELIPELVKGAPQSIEDGSCQSDDEYMVDNWQSWQPDPVDAAAVPVSSKSIRSSDIVSILVNIYESKDLFVEEYQRLLAQKFLSNFECNVDHERRNLELLTLRFGESDLHACEVMLQDMTSSKRLDNRINSGEIEAHHFKQFPIKCLVLSEQFWPEKLGLPSYDEASKIKLPSDVDEAIETYTKAFETIKGSRTLYWTPYLGSVELELEFKDRKLSFTVSPVHASIIWQFQEKKSWLISELSQAISVPTQILRRKISFWQNKGILKEVKSDKFVLVEDLADNDESANQIEKMNVEEFASYDEDLLDTDLQNNQRNDEEGKFRVYWSFIENMLTNLNALPLERIHTMLQMFALQNTSSNELSVQSLRQFLDSKVREQKLLFTGGQYRLPSS